MISLQIINKWGHYRKLIFFKSRLSLIEYITNHPKLYYITSGHGFSEMFFNKKISDKLAESAPFLPDGKMSVIMAFIYIKKIVKQIPGWYITKDILEYADKKKQKVYVLGGDNCTSRHLRNKCPNIVLKINTGFYTEESNLSPVINEIKNFKPNLILVALGAPKQELIATLISKKIKNVLILPIGIALNMFNGLEQEVPKFFKVMGLAWLHRLILSPKKMIPRIILIIKYIINSVPYYFYIIKNIKKPK